MTISDENLIWLDMEMTGLDPFTDHILEVATVITNQKLEILAEGPNLVVFQSEEVLGGMDEWNTTQHTSSGLIERVRSAAMPMRMWRQRPWPSCGNGFRSGCLRSAATP